MRLTTKLILVLFLLLLASSLVLMHGCSGRGSGGCPDNTAPDGSTITAPTNLSAPSVNGTLYPTLGFTVKGPDGTPMNGICVEIFTNGAIALHTGLPDGSNVSANPQTSIVTRTDNSGSVVVEFATPPTTAGSTFFVEVASGAISGIAPTPPAQ